MSNNKSSWRFLRGFISGVAITLVGAAILILIEDYRDYLNEPKLIINYQWIEISASETEQEDKDMVSSPRIVARDPQTQKILKELGSVQIAVELVEAYAIGPGGQKMPLRVTAHQQQSEASKDTDEYKYVAKFLFKNTGNEPITTIEIGIEVPVESIFRIILTPNIKLTLPYSAGFKDISSKHEAWQTFVTTDVYQAGDILKIRIEKLAKRSNATLTLYWYPKVYELETLSLRGEQGELSLPQIRYLFSDQTKGIIPREQISFDQIQKIERDLLGGLSVPWATTGLTLEICFQTEDLKKNIP